MAQYTLTGFGILSLPPRTQRVYVSVSTQSTGYSNGSANPVNYYGIGLIRFGESGWYDRALPIDGDACYFDVPNNATEVGYHIFPGGTVQLFDVHP